ncbi:hypothetical protein ACP275_09G083300 [Erythranthe tilingii]
MAAYAALLSLRHIIEQLQHHPSPPISLDQNQVQSLTDNLNFLQKIIEQEYACVGISKEAIDVFESRIADAAHAAEDIIETRVVDQILGGWNTRMQDCLLRILSIFCGAGLDVVEKISSDELYQGLEKVIQDMGLIKKDVMEIKEKNIGVIEDHLHINSSTLAGAASSRSHLTTRRDAVVGLDELLIEVMDKLIERQSNLRIIPIVGMGGIEILLCASKDESREILSGKSEGELGERAHKSLYGRRYLIVLDDIWSAEAWDEVNRFFPDNGQRSRIMITTRLSDVASISSHGLVMDFLNEHKSWNLLCRSVFEEEDDCPPELEKIGKKIAKNCKGLSLSIVVIGGLLAKSKPTREYWEYISENLNSIVNMEDDERCLKVLLLSYRHLPVLLGIGHVYAAENKNFMRIKRI